MAEIEDRVSDAKSSALEMERFLKDYLPFIQKQASAFSGPEYDDLLSAAMAAFAGCVLEYAPEKGSFLAFAAACIRNRLCDACRRELRYAARRAPLLPEGGEEHPGCSPVERASLAAYSRELERQDLRCEMEAYARALSGYGLSFGGLDAVSPKRRAARLLCLRAARYTVQDPLLRRELVQNKRLSRRKLAGILGVSPKTIEKHRKYIVAVAALLMGDFPGIRAFLPGTDGGGRDGL